MQQSTKNYKEERLDFWIGVAVMAVVLLLVGWLTWSIVKNVKNNARAIVGGEILTEGSNVRGTEQIYTFVPDADIAEGTPIVWTVDGETVQQCPYEGEPMILNYTHKQAGRHEIVASAGRYMQKMTADVTAPVLTLTAPSLTMVYGEELPELLPQIEGFVENERTDFCYGGLCRIDAEKLHVGVYRIVPDDCQYADYQTERIEGTLTVLPRELGVENILVKCYDGNNVLENPDLHVTGVLQGDEVQVDCEQVFLENKNVGSRLALLGTASLVGEDACNYVLPDFAEALIVPKALALVGTSVQDKTYDGTTKATIDKMGTLEGVCDGDSVAIGNLETHFDSAEVGTHSVRLDGVSLVGADKDNYVLVRVEGCEAEIQQKSEFWDKLLNHPDTSHA